MGAISFANIFADIKIVSKLIKKCFMEFFLSYIKAVYYFVLLLLNVRLRMRYVVIHRFPPTFRGMLRAIVVAPEGFFSSLPDVKQT